MKRLLFTIAMLLFISGCTGSMSVLPSQATSVPPDRIFMKNEAKENDASVVIVRDEGGSSARFCDAWLYVDGELFAQVRRSEKVEFNVSEGEHIFGVTLKSKGLCGFAPDRQEQIFTFKAGNKKHYRIFSDEQAVATVLPTTITD